MKTIEEIRNELNAKIPADVVAEREGGGGRKLSYLEGWYVIDRLNAIFGQGNWGYTYEHERIFEDTEDGKTSAAYIAKVTLQVLFPDNGHHTVLQDVGYGDGKDRSRGKAHESAIKEAVTDGIKRAAKSLGMSMGLALYDKSQENVEDEKPVKAAAKPAAKAAPVQATVPASTAPKERSREAVNELINKTSLVLTRKAGGKPEQEAKLRELRDLMLKEYGTTNKEELTDAQAKSLLHTLEGMVA